MERRAVIVRGIVQGVGFRPHVFRLAQRLRLAGTVRNESGAVRIEIEGEPPGLDRFCRELAECPPPLASIDDLSCARLRPRGERSFRIVESAAAHAPNVLISPDIATCGDCLRELFDPGDRRYRYPFLNCTNCGPRLTIVRGAPYDRCLTTMAPFAMCDACRREYENPLDRRYHAQPTCCPHCGPRLELWSSGRIRLSAPDPLRAFADALLSGKIGALKGVGGYHLACDASSEAAVSELRRRKVRDDKPLAVMVANVEQAAAVCEVSAAEAELLLSPARPIVLLKRTARAADTIANEVAPENPYLGVMLPYAPLHHLLLDATARRPLVMTSGNRADEPIAYRDDDAFDQLGNIADLFLLHDRAIQIRCDDSVTRVIEDRESPVRRSRGYAPRPIALPLECHRPILAVGGQLKSAFALGREKMAILSHHLGDLDDYRAYGAFERDIKLYEELFEFRPRIIAHDLHPDYASTGYALERARAEAIDLLGVQHHHAHVAACMAENGLHGDVIGVAFDGTGYGGDGAIWGGEFLVASYEDYTRAARLRYVPLPGGDQAIRQPWRPAASHMIDAGCDPARIDMLGSQSETRIVRQLIERRVNSPLTSSAGRLFDAVAAITGVRNRVTFEGQAAMELEWLATDCRDGGSYPIEFARSTPSDPSPCLEIDTRPLVRAVVDDVARGADRRRVARRFHSSMAELIVATCARIRRETRIERVVLSGGVFCNALLVRLSVARLTARGFQVFTHHLVPPGDGGISLGQLAIAAARSNGRASMVKSAAQSESLSVIQGPQ